MLMSCPMDWEALVSWVPATEVALGLARTAVSSFDRPFIAILVKPAQSEQAFVRSAGEDCALVYAAQGCVDTLAATQSLRNGVGVKSATAGEDVHVSHVLFWTLQIVRSVQLQGVQSEKSLVLFLPCWALIL